MRLFHRLVIYFIPVMMFFLLLFGVVIDQMAKNHLTNQIKNSIDAIAQLHQSRLNDYLSFVEQQLQAFNSRLLIRKVLAAHPNGLLPTVKQQQLQQIVLGSQKLIEGFEHIYLISTEQIIAASTEIDLIGKPFSRPAILSQAANKIILGSFDLTTDQQLQLTHAIALLLDDKIVGYLVVTNKAKQILELANEKTGLGQTGESYLVMKNSQDATSGIYLSPLRFDPHAPLVKQFDSYQQQDQMGLAALSQQSASIIQGKDYRGQSVIGSTRYFPKVGWGLVVKMDEQEVLAPLYHITLIIAIGALTIIVLVVIASILIARGIASPLEKMANTAKNIEQGQLDQHFQTNRITELDVLATVFNQMILAIKQHNDDLELLVEHRTSALQTSNNNLNLSLVQLKETQDQLIEAEKMASLGALVAGIAHEVNTPLGAGLGAASHLQQKMTIVHQHYQDKTLTEMAFEGLLNTGLQAMNIIVSNLGRATELIQSFKRIAVDQSSEQMVTFDLVAYIDDVLKSLKSEYKRRRVIINLQGSHNLTINHQAGLFAQIITNVVVNALAHAFEDVNPTHPCTIDISIEDKQDNCVLKFADNGQGMTADVLKHAFDPFFTTKRGLGGSGLGLHIVYNIVTQQLHGSINVTSEQGKGTLFTLVFPKTVS